MCHSGGSRKKQRKEASKPASGFIVFKQRMEEEQGVKGTMNKAEYRAWVKELGEIWQDRDPDRKAHDALQARANHIRKSVAAMCDEGSHVPPSRHDQEMEKTLCDVIGTRHAPISEAAFCHEVKSQMGVDRVGGFFSYAEGMRAELAKHLFVNDIGAIPANKKYSYRLAIIKIVRHLQRNK